MSMEEWTGFELSDQVLDEAAQWISALDQIESAKLSDPNRLHANSNHQTDTKTFESFNQWLSANPQHQQAYAEMSLIWAKSACIHGMSANLCATNVFPFLAAVDGSIGAKNVNGLLPIEDFKQKHLPILQPYTHNLKPNEMNNVQSSPAWAYTLSMGLIFFGLCSPLIQQFL